MENGKKRYFGEDSAFSKGSRFLNQESRNHEKDSFVSLSICYFLEIERRKGKSLQEPLDDADIRLAYRYLDEGTFERFIPLMEGVSDRELETAFDRSLSLISPMRIKEFSKMLSAGTYGKSILFDMPFSKSPLFALMKRGVSLVDDNRYFVRVDGDMEGADLAVYAMFRHLYGEDKVVLVEGAPSSARADIVVMAGDPSKADFNRIDGYLDKTDILAYINTESKLDEEDPFDRYLKEGKIEAIIKSERFGVPYYSALILSEYNKGLFLADLESIRSSYRKSRRFFNMGSFFEEKCFFVPKEKASSFACIYKALSINLDIFAGLNLKSVPLSELVDMRYAATESFFEDNHGEIGFIADREHLDENGGIFGFGKDYTNQKDFQYIAWQRVDGYKWRNSLLEENEIYITRKTSSTKIGIYNPDILKEYAPKKYSEKGKPEVYIFASAVVLTPKVDLINPYYLFAVLYHQNKKAVLVKSSSDDYKHQFFTKDALGKIMIPVLSKGEMDYIGNEFKKCYVDYLRSINEKDVFAEKMENLLVSAVSEIKKHP